MIQELPTPAYQTYAANILSDLNFRQAAFGAIESD